MDAVNARIVASVAEPAHDDEIFGVMATALTAPPDEVDLLDLLVLARGCQEAAFHLQERSDPQNIAGLYHAMGQDMIAKAIDILGAAVGAGLTECGVSRH